MKTERTLPGIVEFFVHAATAVALCFWSVIAHAQSCNPPTVPCQTCPSVTSCAPASPAACSAVFFGSGTTTFSNSTTTCTGALAQTTITMQQFLGPGTICTGPNQSLGCPIAAGTSHVRQNTATITAPATANGVPTLSPWLFGTLALALCVLAFRRL